VHRDAVRRHQHRVVGEELRHLFGVVAADRGEVLAADLRDFLVGDCCRRAWKDNRNLRARRGRQDAEHDRDHEWNSAHLIHPPGGERITHYASDIPARSAFMAGIRPAGAPRDDKDEIELPKR
jgi:hypothetical protein